MFHLRNIDNQEMSPSECGRTANRCFCVPGLLQLTSLWSSFQLSVTEIAEYRHRHINKNG